MGGEGNGAESAILNVQKEKGRTMVSGPRLKLKIWLPQPLAISATWIVLVLASSVPVTLTFSPANSSGFF